VRLPAILDGMSAHPIHYLKRPGDVRSPPCGATSSTTALSVSASTIASSAVVWASLSMTSWASGRMTIAPSTTTG
jgi:hypothetical protein